MALGLVEWDWGVGWDGPNRTGWGEFGSGRIESGRVGSVGSDQLGVGWAGHT